MCALIRNIVKAFYADYARTRFGYFAQISPVRPSDAKNKNDRFISKNPPVLPNTRRHKLQLLSNALLSKRRARNTYE